MIALILGLTVGFVGITGVYYYWGKIKEQRPTIQEAMDELHLAQNKLHKKRELLVEKIATTGKTISENVLVNKQGELCVDIICCR